MSTDSTLHSDDLIETALRGRERDFRQLAEQVPAILYRASLDELSQTTYISPRISELGYTPEEWLADPAIWVNSLHPDDVGAVFAALDQFRGNDRELNITYRLRDRAGHWHHYQDRGQIIRDEAGQPLYLQGIMVDVTTQKEMEDALSQLARRALFLIELPRLAETHDEGTFMQRGLEMAEQFTQSTISFIHFVNDDEQSIELVTWSRSTLEAYCQAAFDRHYPVSQAGIWAEALRQRKPMVFNDYAAAPGKHGLPEGHAHLERLISLPVFDQDKVVMLVGIGNKASDYVDQDVQTLQLIANEIWTQVQRGRTRRKLERFSNMLEHALTEIYSFDSKSLRFIDVNFGARQNIGYTMNELSQMTPLDLKPELTAADFEKLIAPLRTGQSEHVVFTTVHRRKDGSTYPVEVRLEVTHDANPVFVAVIHDISERLKTEQTMRQLMQAVDQSLESIVITDLDARIRYVNAAFIANSGFSREEVIGQNPRLLQSGKTPSATYAALWEALSHGRSWEGELFNKRKDGTEFVEWARISPVRQTDGRIVHYLAIKQDITERRQTELDLAENLARQTSLNKKLEEAQNQLLQSEKMASIGQLAAGVAHELNNPISFVVSNLNTLDGYLQDLFMIVDAYATAESAYGMDLPQFEEAHRLKREKDYDFLRDDIHQLLSESQEGLVRVSRIVRDLKDFSRAGDAAMQWADLQVGIDTTLNIVRNELKYKCEVIKEYSDLPLVWCEPSQLNQVFMNLLVNAGQAIAEKGTITIRTGRDGDDVFIAIADTGSGIPAENLSRIFEPFFTTKPVGKGTGLGLSLVYGIIQKHNGRIEVRSEPGKGTTFVIHLPIQPPSDGIAAAPSAPTFDHA